MFIKNSLRVPKILHKSCVNKKTTIVNFLQKKYVSKNFLKSTYLGKINKNIKNKLLI